MKSYLDTNIFVYAALNHPQYGKKCLALMSEINDGKKKAYTSIITLSEALHVLIKETKDREKSLLALQFFLSLPIELTQLDLALFLGSMDHVRKSKLKPNDAIHLASALSVQASAIYSYDKDFDNLEIRRVEP